MHTVRCSLIFYDAHYLHNKNTIMSIELKIWTIKKYLALSRSFNNITVLL